MTPQPLFWLDGTDLAGRPCERLLDLNGAEHGRVTQLRRGFMVAGNRGPGILQPLGTLWNATISQARDYVSAAVTSKENR